MKKFFQVVLILAFVPLAGQSPQEFFKKGNKLYQQEQYNEAVEAYDTVIDKGFESAALYFNLANAYYKTNQVAKAILYYEKAARLEPYDDEIQQNLEIARQSTIDKFEEMPQPIVRATYLAILRALSPSGWAVIALIGFFLLVLGSFLYLFTGYRRPGFSIALTGLLLGIFCLSFAYLHQGYIQDNKPAIVMSASSYVKSGPGEKAEDVFILHEGAKVKVTETYQEWRKIKLPDGKVGWIDAKDIELI